MKVTKAIVLMCTLLMLVSMDLSAGAQAQIKILSQCVPFGGTIYGWHNGDSWFGVGDFTFGRKTMHATVSDPNTAFTDNGDTWLGTEEATFTFASGEKVTLMTDFVTEHQTDPAGTQGVDHVNEIGYFARGTGRFQQLGDASPCRDPSAGASPCRRTSLLAPTTGSSGLANITAASAA